ncbi:MAG: Stk1 family PASTA domain-containing Ser/Thr kinase, partial [Phascolarctobacterium sp.]|nr:Stk1 family PASTA domain-containing Ser/Thr kinase [Candidatus Phascolarctobacterium equi]
MEQIIKNRYKVIRSIGSGGMSEVFLAHDELLDRDVAVKRLRDQFVSDKMLLKQFNREAKSAARLVHPNIIGIYDVIDDGNDQYIVMEYVNGKTLKDILNEYQMDPKAAMQITMQLADALQRAHDNNIVHCDIKPQNILIGSDMIPKIADFGIAKMVSGQTMVYSNSVMGSVHYISPEQASGSQVTAASDIYSLGIVLYEMLTGEVPFDGDTPVAVAMMQVDKPLPSLSERMQSVPKGLQNVVDLMTAKKPANRYKKAKDVARALRDILEEDVDAVDEDEMENTLMMEPVKSGSSKGKIFAVSLNKAAVAAKAKDWQEQVKYYIQNFKWSFDSIVVALTVAVCCISFIAHLFFENDNAMTTIPNVVSMQVEEAKGTLMVKDYEVVLQEESSMEVEAGKVIRQSPLAGEKRRRGSTVKLVYSVGAEKHVMPDLIDMSLVKAQTTLDELG